MVENKGKKGSQPYKAPSNVKDALAELEEKMFGIFRPCNQE
jgi:hypothetical protein